MSTNALVLLSGGIDSAATLAVYRQRSDAVAAVFVDYGQAAAVQEEAAAIRVAAHFAVPLSLVRCSGLGQFAGGYVRGRNAFLLHTALTVAGFDNGHVALGIHAGTPYVDCGRAFINEVQRCFDIYCDGAIRVVAPFVDQDKRDVIGFCREMKVPLDVTYSCQVGSEPPCRSCRSCLDRKALDVA